MGGRHDDRPAPLILHEPVRGALRVSVCCEVARELGVAAGMPLAEAVAIAGDEAVTQPHDRPADLEALRRLAIRCRAFSPVCGIEAVDERGHTETGQPAECVLLDLLGCTHLFGSDRHVAEAALRTLDRFGLEARAGVGPTVGVAWAASRAAGDDSPCLVDEQDAASWLDRQPVSSLRLPDDVLDGLASFDLRRVGQLRRLPRQTLPSRFGEVLLRRLDQAGGTVPEPVRPLLPPERLSRRWVGEHPVRSPVLAGQIAQRLTAELVEGLPSGVGLVGLSIALGEERSTKRVDVRLARPSSETNRIARLLDLQLERTRLPREITLVEAIAGELASLTESPVDLFGQPVDGDDALGRLMETLSGRLGTDRVCRAEPTGEVLPERAVRWVPVIGPGETRQRTRDPPAAEPSALASRPSLLVDPPHAIDVQTGEDGQPVRLRRRGQVEPVAHAWGPERIETGWWLGDTTDCSGERRRDYWQVQLASGACLWIYRDLRAGRWLHHGTF